MVRPAAGASGVLRTTPSVLGRALPRRTWCTTTIWTMRRGGLWTRGRLLVRLRLRLVGAPDTASEGETRGCALQVMGGRRVWLPAHDICLSALMLCGASVPAGGRQAAVRSLVGCAGVGESHGVPLRGYGDDMHRLSTAFCSETITKGGRPLV